MTTISSMAHRAAKMVSDNSPVILTAIGVTGCLTTAYLTGKASFKASEILREYDDFNAIANPRTKKSTTELIWKLYIPAVSSGVLTCSAIIMANRVGTRRAAAMASAFTISEKAFAEYKDKVIDQIGKNKEEKLRADVAQDRVNASAGPNPDWVAGEGQSLFYDMWSGRYFYSTMQDVRTAENDINRQILHNSYASLTDFYNQIALRGIKTSDDIGWNSEKLLELRITTVTSEDQRPCFAIDFEVVPKKNYFQTH